MESAPGRFAPDPAREKIFTAPPLAVALALSMPVLFFFQRGLADGGLAYAFRPATLAHGGWTGLFTAMLLHSSWVHVGMNAVGALTFGAPVARLMPGVRGGIAFFVLYIVCGVLAALGYGLVHPYSYDPMVGASGAVFGLIGGATRLLGGHGRVLALTERRVLSAAFAWMAVNAFTGLIGFAPGVEGARIAWEAHAFGFIAGLLLIGPFARGFGGPPSPFDSAGRLSDPAA